MNRQKVIEALDGKIISTFCKQWPNYDSEVHIIYIPTAKKANKPQKGKKAKAASL